MTDDVVFLVYGRAPFERAEFLTAFRANAAVRIEGTSQIIVLQITGEVAYLRGRLALVITPHDGMMIQKSCHTLTILKKQRDGRWRLAREANLTT